MVDGMVPVIWFENNSLDVWRRRELVEFIGSKWESYREGLPMNGARTVDAGWSAIQSTMEWFPTVDSSTNLWISISTMGCDVSMSFLVKSKMRWWFPYRSTSFVSPPMVDGMVPESWFENKYLSSNNRISHIESVNNERPCHLQLKIGKWISYRAWRFVSPPMVDGMVPDSWFENSSLPIKQSSQPSGMRSEQRKTLPSPTQNWRVNLVQSLKICERSNGRWNGSRELVQLQQTFSTITISDMLLGVRECTRLQFCWRTGIEDWSTVRWLKEWCHWVDSRTSL